MNRAALVILAALTLIGITAAGMWYGMRPVPIIETAKPADTQEDGSKVIERTKTQPKARPKQIVPKGAKVERIESVTVRPTAISQADKPCPPVTVDMTLVREPDGSKRVVASSPDGQVVAGLDVPVETLPVPDARPWAVGISVDPVRQTAGLWAERDIGRVRFGIEISQAQKGLIGSAVAEIRVRAGWAF